VSDHFRIDRAGGGRRRALTPGVTHSSADNGGIHSPACPLGGFLCRGQGEGGPVLCLCDGGNAHCGSADCRLVHPRAARHGTAHALGRRGAFALPPHPRPVVGGTAAHCRRTLARREPLMGWTLGRYFFIRYATITAWFFLGIFALVFLIDFTELTGRIARLSGFSYATAISISALRVPMIMVQTVPFVGLFSAMATLVSLNRKYELVIARSAGISAWQFLLPPCIGALLFGVLTVAVLNPLAAYGYSQSERIESELRSDNSNEVSANSAPWLRQKTETGDTIIGA